MYNILIIILKHNFLLEMKKKYLVIFMPSIEGGGVEKNLVILANFFSKHLNDIKLITFDDFYKKKIGYIEISKETAIDIDDNLDLKLCRILKNEKNF